jgi:AcrR family transcriptional regulator
LEEELLAGARRVFGRLGYSEASVEDILLEAAVSRHSFYRLFLSKADVYQKLVDRHVRQLLAELERAVERATLPEEKLRAGVGVYLAWIADMGPFWRVMESQQISGGRPTHVRRRTVDRVAAIAARETELVFGEAPDPALIDALIAAVEALGRSLLLEGAKPSSALRLREIGVRLLLQGLTPQTSGAEAPVTRRAPRPRRSR